jgi:hypothetical protein
MAQNEQQPASTPEPAGPTDAQIDAVVDAYVDGNFACLAQATEQMRYQRARAKYKY